MKAKTTILALLLLTVSWVLGSDANLDTGGGLDLSTTVAVTGCLSGSPLSGGYTLTDGGNGASYDLVGNTESLRPLVGNEVWVTGQLVNAHGSVSTRTGVDRDPRGTETTAPTSDAQDLGHNFAAGRVLRVSAASKLVDHCGVSGMNPRPAGLLTNEGLTTKEKAWVAAILSPGNGQSAASTPPVSRSRTVQRKSSTPPPANGNAGQAGTASQTTGVAAQNPNVIGTPCANPLAGMTNPAAGGASGAISAPAQSSTANPAAMGTPLTAMPAPQTTSAPIPGVTMSPGAGTTNAPIPGETTTPTSGTTNAPLPSMTAGTAGAPTSAGMNSGNTNSASVGAPGTAQPSVGCFSTPTSVPANPPSPNSPTLPGPSGPVTAAPSP